MDASDYLFDVTAYTKRSWRAIPLRPPRKTMMPPEVWAALLRVKRALDDPSRRRAVRRDLDR